MEKEVFETRTAKIWLGEDGILYAKILPKSEITLEDIKEQFKIASKLGNNKRVPFLIDSRGVKFIEREARKFIQEESKKIVTKLAILIGSYISRLIGNFFLGINKNPYPTKLFTSKDNTIEWLKGFIELSERTKEVSKDGRRNI